MIDSSLESKRVVKLGVSYGQGNVLAQVGNIYIYIYIYIILFFEVQWKVVKLWYFFLFPLSFALTSFNEKYINILCRIL